MSESFLAYGDKLECVVKNAFAVSYIYLSSCYKNELRKCCKSWGLIDNRPKRQTHIEPVRDFVKARRLSAQRIGEDNGSDDDKLAWLCSVGNDSFRAIVENLNGDVVGKYFELSEESIIETRVGFSESHVESSFDRACLSFKDNLLLSAEAIVCLILRDTQAFDGDIVSAWINVPGSNGVFQLTVNALRFHFHNLKNFLKEYVYGIFVVILCQKMTTLYGQFIRYLHAHVVSSDLVRSKFTSVSIAQIRDDLDNLIATFDYGISLVFPSHVVSEECIRHRARVSIEISRLQQLKTFFSYSPSSAEVMQVVHELVKEAQIKKSFAINLSNMVEACLSLCVNATAGDKHAAKESERKAAEKTLTKPEKRKSLFTFFGAGGEDPEESVSAAINQSRKHISGFVAVEMLRRLQDVDTTLNDSSSVSQETFSDVSIWGEYVTTLMTTSYDIATISFMAHENKPLILRETIIDIDNKIVPVKPGKAKLLLQHVRALQLPNLGLHFRKAPLQLHCRLGNDEVTTNAVRGGRTCEWEEAIEFEISDLSALSRRQLYIDIFFRGTLWGNVSVGQCVFFLVGLSSTDLTVKSEVNFHHSADSVKEVLQRNNDGDLVTKTYVEATMKIVILASS